MTRDALTIELPAELVDAIVARVLVVLRAEQQQGQQDWLDVAGAAAYLAVPTSRVYRRCSQGRIPHYKDGARTFFVRSELDEWRKGGAL